VAVARTVMRLSPTSRAMAALAEPLVTAASCTVTVTSLLWVVVGVSFTWVTGLSTVAE